MSCNLGCMYAGVHDKFRPHCDGVKRKLSAVSYLRVMTVKLVPRKEGSGLKL
jgi:hypothetical protein